MAVYNHETTVAEALDSALMQKMPYRSVIYCLNDASTDRSGEILGEYAKRYPGRVKVYTSPTNFGSGKQSFLYHRPPANGRYWCLLAGDDFWTSPDKLAKQITFLDANPEFTGASCDTLVKNEVTGEESFIKPCRNEFNLLDLILLKHKYAFYVHTTSIIWRNIYIHKGFFLPPAFKKKYARGDVMLMHMMLGKGGKVKNIPEVMSCYRMTGRGVWTSKSEEEQKKLNDGLVRNSNQSVSIRIRIYLFLQPYRSKYKVFNAFIPGPINE
tara:strand:+ start:375 stop:1181 length:807 start_codon:yes stop_codon:yes gene_type:complete